MVEQGDLDLLGLLEEVEKLLRASRTDEVMIDAITVGPKVGHFPVAMSTDVNHKDHLLDGCLKDLDRLLLAGCKVCACEFEARRSRSLNEKTPGARGLGA